MPAPEQITVLDAACLTAHGASPGGDASKTLVAVFAGLVAHELLLVGARLGYRVTLLEPDERLLAEATLRVPGCRGGVTVDELDIDPDTDIVMTDHHRDELGPVLRDLLGTPARWVGLMGSPRHQGPHLEALRSLGVDASDVARVHRPIGLNIGSRTPAEIAVSTLAGLVADRAERPGDFFETSTPADSR